MENESREEERKASLISSFCEITSSPRAEAEFFLESHGWDLDAAVSTFLDDDVVENPNHSVRTNDGTGGVGGVLDSPSQSPGYAPSDSSPSEPSPPRSRSPTPPASRDPYRLRSRRIAEKQSEKPSGSRQTGASGSNIRSFADLNRSPPSGAESDSDEGQEYYTGGQKRFSGMLVQDPRKVKDVDAIFDQARHSAVERPAELSRPSARSFTGTGRLLSGETVPASSQQPQPPQDVSHTITFWRNGFTVDDGPLRRLDDPANATFLESISNSECPKELQPTDRRVRVHVDLIRREENFEQKPPKPGQRAAFLGVGRTLGSTSTPAAASDAPPPVTTSPSPSMGLVVDPSLPTTSIQLRLADGTRLVSRFNHHHTIRDIRGFIDASRPGGRKDYQLLTMGFPPKQLADLDQTIEQAGISNSVVIQKF